MGIRSLFLRLVTPLQKIMQRIGNPEPRISDQFVRDVQPLLKNGDILLSQESWRFTNLFVPGFWGHAAIYRNGFAIEAIFSGVRGDRIEHWLYGKDSVVVLRPRYISELGMDMASLNAFQQIGKMYDYEFAPGDKAFFCSELIVWSYSKAGYETSAKDTVTPQDLYNMTQWLSFDIIKEEVNK